MRYPSGISGGRGKSRGSAGSRMKPVKKIVVLGSGALKIGEAGEFDYSGTQALKALKEAGIPTVLVNPNIATVQTSKGFADKVYFLPVTAEFVENVVRRERPDGIFLAFGGQTALNCGLELARRGILEKFGVRVLGTPVEAILLTEDRERFARHLRNLGIPVPPSGTAKSLREAERIARAIGLPVMVRGGFALGGENSGVARSLEDLRIIAQKALAASPHILVEKYLHHFKEVEYEIVRDRAGNSLAVCAMENMDPLGIHTGESVVVAPTQTLDNREYHALRNAALRIVESLGIVGECNVQFALNPKPKKGETDFSVIEVNARLSRSSALASKATGYPLAYVAARLALGELLADIPNQVTKATGSFFEPALDYVALKIPRWDLGKFPGADRRLGSAMKSVGEVMAVGRTFEEALQKGVRMLQTGRELLDADGDDAELGKLLRHPTPERLFVLAAAFKKGWALKKIAKLTGIDGWFLSKIQRIAEEERSFAEARRFAPEALRRLKLLGFSDKRIGAILGKSEMHVRMLRKKFGIRPRVLQIDTLAGEFPAETNYLYLSYGADHDDVAPLGRQSLMILGGGPYRIGSSVEFDWSAVHSASALRKLGKRSIVVNCNPETVSTDYDQSDRLYFEAVDLETTLDIHEFERSSGVMTSVGGQASNALAIPLAAAGVPLFGTAAENIDCAERRGAFSALLDRLRVAQPAWHEVRSGAAAEAFAQRVGYPVLVRPSYVLSGEAMRVCRTGRELRAYIGHATTVGRKHPIVISKFMEGALEVECDLVAQKGEVIIAVVAEHVERAGVHSGDATIVFPARELTPALEAEVKTIAARIAAKLGVSGPMNLQCLVREGRVYVIEANLRASRTFPLLSKAADIDLASLAVLAAAGKARPARLGKPRSIVVKSAQFSFARVSGAMPRLGVEMASTGEAAAFGATFEEALLFAFWSTNPRPHKKAALVLGGDPAVARNLRAAGWRVKEEKDTAGIRAKKYGLVIELQESNDIRRAAAESKTALVMDPYLAAALARAFAKHT